MSSFQPYRGEYEHAGGTVRWRCYATARLFGVLPAQHGPFPSAPEGMKWLTVETHGTGPEVGCLVERGVAEVTPILLQIDVVRAESDQTPRSATM